MSQAGTFTDLQSATVRVEERDEEQDPWVPSFRALIIQGQGIQ